MSTRSKFIGNTAWLMVMTIAQHIFPLFTLPYLTRVLQTDVYAVIVYLTSTMTFVRIFMKFGFDLSSTKTIAEHREDKQRIGAVLGATMQANAVLAGITLLAYTGITFAIPIMRENILLAYLYLAGVYMEILLPDYLFLGLQRMQSITGRFILARTISTVFTFVLVRSKSDVYWVPILNILGSLVAAGTIWYQILFTLKIKTVFARWKESLKLLRVSGEYFLSKFATTAFGAVNTLILGIVAAPKEQIAYWGVSYGLISSAIALYSPIISSLYPHMVNRRDTKLIRVLLGVLMPAIVLVTAGLFFCPELVIRIFCGPEYTAGAPVFQALLPVLIFSFPAQVLGLDRKSVV
jgi:PST family polysaccharide transporter